MDPQQFQQLLQGLVQQDNERRTDQGMRNLVRDLVRQTATCDGATTTSMRLWIREIQLAFDQVGAAKIIEIISGTITGPLRFEVERFIGDHIAAHNINCRAVPWADLRNHVSTQFLNVDEAAALRDEITKVHQSAYEPEAQYSRRFREVADVAYPQHLRNIDQERILVKAYACGLASNEKLVEVIRPIDLNAAITGIGQLSEWKDAYSRLVRQETPMEIGAVSRNDNAAKEQRTMESLCCTVEKLCTKVAKMEASDRNVHPTRSNRASDKSKQPSRQGPSHSGRSTNPPQRKGHAWDEHGRPRCFECNTYGHFARECQRQRSTPPNIPL